MADFTPQELRHYSRHLIMPEVGLEGQKKLKNSKILIVGMGGLGSPAAIYLAAAGIGQIGLVDFDVVEPSNLGRQIIHSYGWVGKSKLESAKNRLAGINPFIKVETFEMKLTYENAFPIFERYDLVLDGSDNFTARYAINDTCVRLGKPWIYGSIFRFEGQVSFFWANQQGPCYRCLYPKPPKEEETLSCADGGVFGVLPGVIGALQATEAVKWIIGAGESLIGSILLFDALAMEWKKLKVNKDPDCLCRDSKAPYLSSTGDKGKPFDSLVSQGQEGKAVNFKEAQSFRAERSSAKEFLGISVDRLRSLLDQKEKEEVVVLDIREPKDYALRHLPNSKIISLDQIPSIVQMFSKAGWIVVCCETGVRSLQAARLLRGMGFSKVVSLSGGIGAWFMHNKNRD